MLEEVPPIGSAPLTPVPLSSPLQFLSPQRLLSFWQFFRLYVCTGLLLAFSALRAVYTSSQQPAVVVPAPQLVAAEHFVRKLSTAHQRWLRNCWQHEVALHCYALTFLQISLTLRVRCPARLRLDSSSAEGTSKTEPCPHQ